MRGRVPFFSADAGRRSQVGFPAFFALCRRIPSFLPFLRLISSPSRSVSPSAPFLCGEKAISETFIPLRRTRYSDRTFLHGFGAIRTRFRFPSVGNIRFPRPSTSESVSPHNIFRHAPPFCRARFLPVSPLFRAAFCSVSPLFRAAFHSRFPSVFAPRFPFHFSPLFRPSCNPVSRPGLPSFFTPVFRPFFRSVFDPFPAPFSHAFAADVFAV